MRIIDNPELTRSMFDHLTKLYNIKKQRTKIHLSTLIYCLTRSFFDMKMDVEPTDMEVLLFALGLGLQDEFTPDNALTDIVFEKDGITFSPDFVTPTGFLPIAEDHYCEMKTTRMSSARDFPTTWIEYIKGGCHIRGVDTYDLSVLYMMGNYKPPFPQLNSFRLEFDEYELDENWDYILARKKVFDKALENKMPPTPKVYCGDWECKNCRFKVQCDVLSLAVPGMLDSQREED